MKIAFYENPEYHEIQKKPHDVEASDESGPIEIPSSTSFWMIVNSKGVFALSSRRNDITKS